MRRRGLRSFAWGDARSVRPTETSVDVRSHHDSAIDPPFNLRREDVGDVAVVVVEGEVDMVTAPALQEELESIAPGTSVVIDICDTPFRDSTGLWVLFAARQPDGACPHRVRPQRSRRAPVRGRGRDTYVAESIRDARRSARGVLSLCAASSAWTR